MYLIEYVYFEDGLSATEYLGPFTSIKIANMKAQNLLASYSSMIVHTLEPQLKIVTNINDGYACCEVIKDDQLYKSWTVMDCDTAEMMFNDIENLNHIIESNKRMIERTRKEKEEEIARLVRKNEFLQKNAITYEKVALGMRDYEIRRNEINERNMANEEKF